MLISPPHKRRRDLLLKLPSGGVGCEVGVWKADFAAELLRVTEAAELHLVDPWASNPDRSDEWYSIDQPAMDRIYESVVDRFESERRVAVYRAASPEAAGLFDDGMFDWVYLDGDHAYEGIRADLDAWYPKVKPGGVLCGDDYDTTHWWGDAVRRAVREFVEANPVVEESVAGDQFWVRC